MALSSSSIGVEDVQLHFSDDVAGFSPPAVPRLRDPRTGTSWIRPSCSSDDQPPASQTHRDTDRTNDELHPKTSASCQPQVLGQVRMLSCDHEEARSGTALAMEGNMLRGVQSGVVLRRGARLLSSAAGSAATFQLSTPTDHLEAFISHNWSVGRSRKWLALSLHYHFSGALVCGILVAGVLCVVSSVGWLPLPAVDDRNVKQLGMYCSCCGFLAFHVVLLFSSDVLPGFFMQHHRVFLDKVCIHQVDKELQRQGIESLGGFLFHSWSMVVLYTPVYTTKVWTVYEMACFLCVHPGGRLVWLPVDVASEVVLASFLNMFYNVAVWEMSLVSTRERLALPWWLLFLPLVPLLACMLYFLGNVARDQAKSEADLRHFSIRNAVCAVESDRAVVESNVASLMRDLKLLPSDSTHEEALQVFDRMVQRTLPRAMRSSIGRAGIRYELVVVVFCAPLFRAFDIVAAQVFAGASSQAVVATVLERTTLVFALLPLRIAFFRALSGRCAHLIGGSRVLFVLLLSGVWLVWDSSLQATLELALSVAREDLFALVLFSLVSAACFLLTYFVFRRAPGQQHVRRKGAVSETMEDLAEALAFYNQQLNANVASRRSFEWTGLPMCFRAWVRGEAVSELRAAP